MSLFDSFKIKISTLNFFISVKDSFIYAKTMQKAEMPLLMADNF